MASGGYEPIPTDDNERGIDNKGADNNGDGEDAWADVDWNAPIDPKPERRNPFEPAASSTPADSERLPLKIMTRLPPEKQGTSTETSFTTGFDQGVTIHDSLVKRELEDEFPNMSSTELEFRTKEAPKSGGAVIEVRYHSSEKWYRLFTKSKGDGQKTLNTSLPKQISQALGKSTAESINETNTELETMRQQEKTKEKQLRQTQSAAEEAQRLKQEMSTIRNRIQDKDNRMQEIENAHGPLDSDAIQKLNDEKRQLETEHKAKRKELNAIAKTADQARKLQQELNTTRLRKGETERPLGELKKKKRR